MAVMVPDEEREPTVRARSDSSQARSPRFRGLTTKGTPVEAPSGRNSIRIQGLQSSPCPWFTDQDLMDHMVVSCRA